jgi:Ni/Co efflux regulator RcnB
MSKLVIGMFVAALAASSAAFADDADHHGTMGGAMMGMAMHHHGWHHGDTLPRNYWHASEVDWHRTHLRQPPHGYHWVRVDDDYVLVALGTGLILDTAIAGH